MTERQILIVAIREQIAELQTKLNELETQEAADDDYMAPAKGDQRFVQWRLLQQAPDDRRYRR